MVQAIKLSDSLPARPLPRPVETLRAKPAFGVVREAPTPERATYGAMDDAELLQHVVRGSELAWDTFFRRFRGLILSCAVKAGLQVGAHLGGDDLMDVLGDACLNMVAHDFRRLRLYRPDGGCSVATWIGVIATSTARDYLRRARRHRLEPTADAELDRLVSPSIGPEEVLIDRQRRAFVDRAFQQLSSRDQEFVELYFADAESPEDIARQMGVSVATVYSKKAKIKSRLLSMAQLAHDAAEGHA